MEIPLYPVWRRKEGRKAKPEVAAGQNFINVKLHILA